MAALFVSKALLLCAAYVKLSFVLQGCESTGFLADVAAPVSWKEVGKGKCIPPQDGFVFESQSNDKDACRAECEQGECDAYAFSDGNCSMVKAPNEVIGNIELKALGYLEGKTDGDDKFVCYRKMSCERFTEGTYHDSWTHWPEQRNFDVTVKDDCDLHFKYEDNSKVAFLLGTRLLVNGWHLGQFNPNHKNGDPVVTFSDKGNWYAGSSPNEDDDFSRWD